MSNIYCDLCGKKIENYRDRKVFSAQVGTTDLLRGIMNTHNDCADRLEWAVWEAVSELKYQLRKET